MREPSVSFAYSNRMLAPVTLTLSVSQTTERYETTTVSGFNPLPGFAQPTPTYTERDRLGAMQLTRAFYGNPVSLGAMLDNRYIYDVMNTVDFSVDRMRLAGGYVSAAYEGVETTPYAGVRRLVYVSWRARFFPASWGTLGASLVDLRGALDLTTPLPLFARHTLELWAVGRVLDRGPATFPLLRVGGLPSSILWRHPSSPVFDPELDPRLPSAFTEALRGFEDFPFATNAIALAEATYHCPFIIDHGWASTLWILPSLFVRELDLELFGAAAGTGATALTPEARHEAAGGALSVSAVFGPATLTVGYQLSRRLTDDRALTQLVTLSN